MARAVIAYDKDLPEIPGRLAHLGEPTSYLGERRSAERVWRGLFGGARADAAGREAA